MNPREVFVILSSFRTILHQIVDESISFSFFLNEKLVEYVKEKNKHVLRTFLWKDPSNDVFFTTEFKYDWSKSTKDSSLGSRVVVSMLKMFPFFSRWYFRFLYSSLCCNSKEWRDDLFSHRKMTWRAKFVNSVEDSMGTMEKKYYEKGRSDWRTEFHTLLSHF